uniref:Uncharacterized protein LOC114348050 n=1 Tax=Diabrotica virgifera virgifera TaxID=50390 RepID=A0A6P7HFG3_DIAVI
MSKKITVGVEINNEYWEIVVNEERAQTWVHDKDILLSAMYDLLYQEDPDNCHLIQDLHISKYEPYVEYNADGEISEADTAVREGKAFYIFWTTYSLGQRA